MPLSLPYLKAPSQGKFSSVYQSGYKPEKINKPPLPVDQRNSTRQWMSSNANDQVIGLKTSFRDQNNGSGNPIYRSGAAKLNGLGEQFSIPNALAQSLQYESGVNQGRSGLSDIFSQSSNIPVGNNYTDNNVLKTLLARKTATFNENNKALTQYGDAEGEMATTQSELNDLLRPETIKEGLNVVGQMTSSNESALQRQLRIKELQNKVNSLSKVMANRSVRRASEGGLNDSTGIRDMLNNYIPTSSNLPIKETVVST